jgi:hypothetical protein
MAQPDNETRFVELSERLAKAQAARKEEQAKNAELRELQELEEQVRKAEQAAQDEPHISKAESELGTKGRHFAVVETDLGVVIRKRPKALIFRKFQDSGKSTTTAFEGLVSKSLYYPSPGRFAELCEEIPYLITKCADVVSYLAGVRKRDLDPKS